MICDVLAPCGLSSLDLCQSSLRGIYLTESVWRMSLPSSETIIDVSLWCFLFLDSVIICVLVMFILRPLTSFNPSGSGFEILGERFFNSSWVTVRVVKCCIISVEIDRAFAYGIRHVIDVD